MKRPLAVVGLTLFFVMLALSFLSASRAAVAAGAVFFGLLLGSVLHPRLRRSGFWPTLCFSGLLGCLLFLSFCALQRQPALSLAGTRDVLTCEARSYPTPNSTGKRMNVTAKVTLDDDGTYFNEDDPNVITSPFWAARADGYESYSITGSPTTRAQKGIHIIRTRGGKAYKVLMK